MMLHLIARLALNRTETDIRGADSHDLRVLIIVRSTAMLRCFHLLHHARIMPRRVLEDI